MTTIQICIALTALLGLYMAWNIGANDVANSMADAVGSGALTVKHAIIAAALCEFAGAVLVGGHVADTVRKGIVDPAQLAADPNMLALGMACALLAAALWLNIASWMGLPVSTTHSIVGAVAGFGIVAVGIAAVQWGTMAAIVASWFISPVAGAIMAFVLFKLMTKFMLACDNPAEAAIKVGPAFLFLAFLTVTMATLFKGMKHLIKERAEWLGGATGVYISIGLALLAAIAGYFLLRRFLSAHTEKPLPDQLRRVERAFVPVVIISSCSVAFAHGANDVANAVGPLAAVVDVLQTGEVKAKVGVPFWVLALGGIGIVCGLATYGVRVMETVGKKITEMTPTRGVAADIAAAAVVLICSRLKLPISTTHVLVGAILGVGFARGLGAVDLGVTRNIFGAWLITVPCAGIMSIILFLIARGMFFG